MPPRRSRAWLISAIVILALLALLGWLGGTTGGARTVLSVAASITGGKLQAQGIAGRLIGPLQARQLRLQGTGMDTELQDVRLDWRPQALFQGHLHVTSLRVGTILLRQRIGQPSEPASMPADLSLPLKLTVERLQVDRGTLNWGALNVIELGGFSMRMDYDKNRYRFTLDKLAASSMAAASSDAAGKATPDGLRGDLQGQLTLADAKPYALSGEFHARADARANEQDIAGTGQIRLDGSLAQLQAAVDLAIGAASVKGQATLQPFGDAPLQNARIQAQNLDLAAFLATLPQTRIDGTLVADDNDGTLTITNQEAGTYDAGRLPLRSLSTRFRQDAEGLYLDSIVASLGTAKQAAGELQGSGRLFRGALNLAVTTASLDLHRLDERMLETHLTGSAGIRHESGRQEFNLDMVEPLQRRRLALSAQAMLANEALALERASLKLGDGELRASGKLQLNGKREFAADGNVTRFHLQDLGQFAKLPDLYLNGKFSLRGALSPQPSADLDFAIADSRLAGQPLKGEGRASLRADSLDIPKLMLVAGANRLDVAGRLEADRGDLRYTLEAPKLDQIGPEFAGSLQVSGNARGSFIRPLIIAQWQAASLRLPGMTQLESSQGKGEVQLDRKASLIVSRVELEAVAKGLVSGALQAQDLNAAVRFAPPADAPLVLQLQAQQLTLAGNRIDSINIDTQGTTGRHTITAKLAQPGQQWQVQAAGALQAQKMRWQGSIEQFNATGRLQAQLAAPSPLDVSPQRIDLRQFRMTMDGALLAIEQFSRDEKGMQTSGRFEQLPLASLLAYLQPQPDIRTDLQFGGEWNVTLAGTPRGSILIRRERGDLSTRGAAPVTLGLQRLEARANADNGKLQLELHADGSNLGTIDINTGVAMDNSVRMGITPQSALSGTARISVPSLRWVAPLLAPTAIAEGSVNGEVQLAGNVGTPRLAGQIKGQLLRLALPDLGVDLRGGSLDASFQDTRLLLQSLAFVSNGGQLAVSGPIDLAGTQPDAQLAIKSDRYPLLTRSDRKLVISGNGNVVYREGRLQASGGFFADSGFFDLGQADKPSLSDDVVIAGQKSSKPSAPPALDVVIGLGEGVTVRGHGLNAVLVGQVQFKNNTGEALKAQGAMRVERGTFAAYGRELSIEKGLLYFNGAPGNPGLDILAMRRGQQVEAGVAVLGTARSPRIVLVSEPPVADAEKLSWLVLGRGLDATTGGGDLAALQGAAGALLGQGAAAGVQAGLASALGLDQLSLGTSSGTLQQRIITAGKQVSSRLHIGIEQGLESASSVLLLRYTISRKLTLEIDTGTRTAFSIFYNFAFD
ncbi:autotransporter secretion inner membrane protein TamB [Paucimonas lemoignei]|uniref:Autotransporter secretion inner membrane protein TamB n=1 Tax=Paucimonas lemoignei TaxID=29443 RepID=A0A4R3I3G2_PAULE|nr:translocation/assembly module TamB domain-containing protein [Paucimonas lemoignei]TCS38459.1 autotransporter secretion inner membrane protein TamB [Paucimonas lemoignei]